uniref:EOG090X06BA n=1 Tax=Alona affinis TaxID=381656 RepID=A0A9N6WNX6_9CRUS|nr:EOG090X06BA [Alona affinis]
MTVDKEVFNQAVEKINSNDCAGLQEILKTHNIQVDSEDSSGMTLLQHSAFKGKKEMCQLLLDLGANPNGGHHEHKYSALHFGALSGNADICQQLLQYGAIPDAVNSVGRTAPQMAAFVNLHPVHLLFTLRKLPLLLDNLAKVKEVLELLRDSQMKRNREANEILSLKYHCLCFLVASLAKEQKQHSDKSPSELAIQYAKLFLKCKTKDGFPEYLDNFIRESIRTFPFKETTIFRQLVMSLTKTKKSADSPLALSLLNSAINGQRGFTDDNSCATCGEEKVPHKCASCKSVQYCDRDCQKLHWPFHKKECESLVKQMKKMDVNKDHAAAASASASQ